jgi:hypothetical protein
VTVVAVVTALSIAVTCWSDRTTSEQGDENRKSEHVFYIGSSFGKMIVRLNVIERCAGRSPAPFDHPLVGNPRRSLGCPHHNCTRATSLPSSVPALLRARAPRLGPGSHDAIEFSLRHRYNLASLSINTDSRLPSPCNQFVFRQMFDRCLQVTIAVFAPVD